MYQLLLCLTIKSLNKQTDVSQETALCLMLLLKTRPSEDTESKVLTVSWKFIYHNTVLYFLLDVNFSTEI